MINTTSNMYPTFEYGFVCFNFWNNFFFRYDHHKGAAEFVFWNLPQVQYRNPNVQIATFKNMTPSPFVTAYLEGGEKVIFDVDCHTNQEIIDR